MRSTGRRSRPSRPACGSRSTRSAGRRHPARVAERVHGRREVAVTSDRAQAQVYGQLLARAKCDPGIADLLLAPFIDETQLQDPERARARRRHGQAVLRHRAGRARGTPELRRQDGTRRHRRRCAGAAVLRPDHPTALGGPARRGLPPPDPENAAFYASVGPVSGRRPLSARAGAQAQRSCGRGASEGVRNARRLSRDVGSPVALRLVLGLKRRGSTPRPAGRLRRAGRSSSADQHRDPRRLERTAATAATSSSTEVVDMLDGIPQPRVNAAISAGVGVVAGPVEAPSLTSRCTRTRSGLTSSTAASVEAATATGDEKGRGSARWWGRRREKSRRTCKPAGSPVAGRGARVVGGVTQAW